MPSYGSVAGVEKFLPHAGVLSATSTPTDTEVEEIIDQREAELNAVLREVGYTVPLSGSSDVALCAGKVDRIAAFDSYPAAFDGEVPENIKKFWDEWMRFLDDIRAGKLTLEAGATAGNTDPVFRIVQPTKRDNYWTYPSRTTREWD